MPATKVGINLSAVQNVSTPNFDFKNNTVDMINDIPSKANSITSGWLGLITLSGLFAFLLWKLNHDNIFGGDFGYSPFRSIGIAGGICAIIGIYFINMGYFSNFYHVVIFIFITFASVGIVWKTER